MRDLVAVLLALCAAVALALWAPATWTRDHLVDRDGFLEIARPLGANPQFQQDVSDAAVEGVLEQAKVPRPLAALIEPTIQDQAAKLTQSASFATIWSDSMGDLHTTLMDPAGGTVTADLNPYVDELVTPVGDLIGQDIDIPDADLLTLDIVTIPASPWPSRVTALASTAPWIGWAGIAAAVASLVLARRRGVIGAVLGAALLVAGGALLLGSQGIGMAIPGSIDDARIVGTLVQAFEARLGRDMVVPSVTLLGTGALALVAALGAMGVRSARRREGAEA